MKTASLVLFILSACTVLLGLFPCLGWLNWFAGILCMATFILGIVGLVADRDPATGQSRHQGIHLLALLGAVGLGIIGLVRLALGGGVL